VQDGVTYEQVPPNHRPKVADPRTISIAILLVTSDPSSKAPAPSFETIASTYKYCALLYVAHRPSIMSHHGADDRPDKGSSCRSGPTKPEIAHQLVNQIQLPQTCEWGRRVVKVIGQGKHRNDCPILLWRGRSRFLFQSIVHLTQVPSMQVHSGGRHLHKQTLFSVGTIASIKNQKGASPCTL
jgi:hypothetical protein